MFFLVLLEDLLIWLKDSRTKSGSNLLKGFRFVMVTNSRLDTVSISLTVGPRSSDVAEREHILIF
jgi:hypothetical protein